MGFRWMAAGTEAGVDGVENAADTFPLVGTAGGWVDDLDGLGAERDSRDGGVNGAPKEVPRSAADDGSGRAVDGPTCGPFVTAGSLGTAGLERGEKGGVRWRDGSLGGALAATGVVDDTRFGSGSNPGSGGGQATDAAGVFSRGPALLNSRW